MTYEDLVSAIEKYGSTRYDIGRHSVGVPPEQVNENVIIAPSWEPRMFPDLGSATLLTSERATIKVWEIDNDGEKYTYIKTGIGSPLVMEVILGLGLTKCKRIVFIGSVGALSADMAIGDFVIPEYSVCGDGASRYIKKPTLKNSDVFGEKAFPNKVFFDKAKIITDKICEENNVPQHVGKNFSTDSIFAEYFHIDEIVALGCNTIEMETAAGFEASAVAKIPMIALFSVSDNTFAGKSLTGGRTEDEMNRRKMIRKKLFPQIISNLFA